VVVIFGDAVAVPTTIASAEWIAGTRQPGWTVGALVPNQYPLVLRVRAPDPNDGDWWSAYRDLLGVVAAVGEQHTSTPDRAWFAVWEGHGFANGRTRIAMQGPLDDSMREALARERSRLRDEDERRNASIRTALSEVPQFELPHRVYYLLTGPVAAATQLQDPEDLHETGWRRPDLFWPDDRRWFVATDVDFWSFYIGGDHDLIADLARRVPTPSEIVPLDQPLEFED
jgi:hypothetical protein